MKKRKLNKKRISYLVGFIVLGIVLYSCISVLKHDEEHAYEIAKAECNSEVITKYTNAGDSYYVCK